MANDLGLLNPDKCNSKYFSNISKIVCLSFPLNFNSCNPSKFMPRSDFKYLKLRYKFIPKKGTDIQNENVSF